MRRVRGAVMTLKTRAAIKAVFGEPLLVDEIELEDPGDEEVLVKLVQLWELEQIRLQEMEEMDVLLF